MNIDLQLFCIPNSYEHHLAGNQCDVRGLIHRMHAGRRRFVSNEESPVPARA
ncbi:hypothetical protein QCE73_21480 [Caballeronia sp. LZ029]|uniref:hypothetical protein n=1 Tax=Caballeronia sp. LZ029 TaxID=3038564 RepID=UPI002864F834|nr:hypothetical protein [Caballeronia sp. LZ029]MDR5745739.1 hypothetical protein [Caballeronia sp. LZ029]